MTSADSISNSPISPMPAAPINASDVEKWPKRVEHWLERTGELLNPILVKEARQALKSNQFTITFTLLLICGWAWSIWGVTMMSPAILFAPSGPAMLMGYFFVLVVPMLVVIPFSAFRSLAVEREDGTFELLSITALNARQVVTGKLGSAMLQMLVYYSAISPCVAFTYLLRGIDIVTIGFVLFHTFFLSVSLSSIGLLVATISRARHWQALLSVTMILSLAGMAIMWSVIAAQMLTFAGPGLTNEPEFWMANAAAFTVYASFSVLSIYAAASQISFATDNRSTRLRVIMFIQQLLFIGWCIYGGLATQEPLAFILIAMSFGGIYWMIVGMLLCGESGQLSPRVKRNLPQTFLGRMFLTWFNPGSGTGYIFVVTNLGCLASICGGMGEIVQRFQLARWTGPAPFTVNWLGFVFLVWAYVTFYLGVSRLLFLLARRIANAGLLLSVLINVFVALFGIGLPVLFQYWFSDFTLTDYSPLQAPNFIWTMTELLDPRNQSFFTTSDGWLVYIPVGVSAVVVWLVNLVVAAKEVAQTRIVTPNRVLEDEKQLHPPAAQEKKKLSPWDNE